MILFNNNDQLLRFMPNVQFTVEGEADLYRKIEPQLESAEMWLVTTFLDKSLLTAITAEEESDLQRACMQAVMYDALWRAIPRLDVVLTPNGFGIVNSQTVAPASKERVERLINSMEDCRDAAIAQMLKLLPQRAEWRASRFGALARLSLFQDMDHVTGSRRYQRFCDMGVELCSYEAEISRRWMSRGLMEALCREWQDSSIEGVRLQVATELRGIVLDAYSRRPDGWQTIKRGMVPILALVQTHEDDFPEWFTSDIKAAADEGGYKNTKEAKGYWL